MTATDMDMDGFCCSVCHHQRPLERLLDLDCSCLVCDSCCQAHIVPAMVPVMLPKPAEPAPATYSVGQLVRYRQRDGETLSAKVVHVDMSIQPYGYGIQLVGAADVRFTEYTRLLPQEVQRQASTAWMQQGTPAVRCPHCSMVLSRAQLSRVCPQALQQLDETLNNAWLAANGIIQCPTPGCEALIEKIPALCDGTRGCTCVSSSSSSSSSIGSVQSSNSSSMGDGNCRGCWKQRHRYRCPACNQSFCDACCMTPYHEGLICTEAAAPCCVLCDARVPEAIGVSAAGLSTRDLPHEAIQLGADVSWCLERSELEAVYLRAKQVCQGCRVPLSRMCSRQLPCGHWCCGVRGTSPCLPCLQPGCNSQARVAGDGNCLFCFEALPARPTIQLACDAGHFVHLSCAKKRLQIGAPGPALTFDFLFCPLCGSGKEGRCGNIQVMTAKPHLMHKQLQAELARSLELRDQVVQLAKLRLKLAGLAKQDQELQPGGKFDGRPVDYAVAKYLFFECSQCHLPYFGGAKECGAGQQQQPAAGGQVDFDAQELVCGTCAAIAAGADCKQHGQQFIEWKCRYCCNLASWFCWGNTHMCSSCHDDPDHRHGNVCPGHGRCHLKMRHPLPGDSCCLGCGVCRNRDH